MRDEEGNTPLVEAVVTERETNVQTKSNQVSDTALTVPGEGGPEHLSDVIQAILEKPENAKQIAESTSIVLNTYADIERRRTGMWIGAGLTLFLASGGIAILVSGAGLGVGLGLCSIGAACAGGTFAVITGRSVGLRHFSAISQILGRKTDQSSGDNEK